ncbi:beta-L-arabinofuranosidase domain-containing protein [Micromonospora sp. NPDC050686]|uniref:glycoside hydrolase family 127 protein n=1 Tax=Micromonospora sp. NPDC050686 TaxID=3154631 RepID=UPI00340CE95A
MTSTEPRTAHHRAGIVPAAPRTGRLRPLGLDEVRITGGFWAERQSVNHRHTLAHIGRWLERAGWSRNFDLAAAGSLPADRRGREFSDSEIYKYLEALAWEIGRTGDGELEATFRDLVGRVERAQEPDGYLNTNFGRPGQAPRWSDLEWGHELYCLGHLCQAAVARARTRPDADDGLLAVARRAADLVCEVFGPKGVQSVCGHAEIEVGLAELARVTGEQRYLRQAQLFVARRGTGTLRPIEWGPQYFQDDAPVRQATVLRGHAVRANYLAAGAVDVAVDTGDEDLLSALVTQWDNTVARRTYITGGQGSHHQDEAFGEDWVLPPDRAYSETCAGIASIMFSWRLLLARGDTRYGDLIERTLYNVVATSPSASGTAFYYANTLHQRTPGSVPDPDTASLRAESSLRAPWFGVSCCPPNVARTFASLDALVATADTQGVQIHQFADCRIQTRLDNGELVALDVQTDYPRRGSVRLTPTRDAADPWTLSVRVPHWADGARLVVTRAAGEVSTTHAAPGWASVRHAFRTGDVVELVLPMRPRLTHPDPRIDAVRGCVAVERGPEVYCLESVDLDAVSHGAVTDVADVRIDDTAPVEDHDGRPLACLVVTAAGPPDDLAWPYAERSLEPAPSTSFDVPLIPYHDWAERGPSTMRVWLPVAGRSHVDHGTTGEQRSEQKGNAIR